MIGIDIEEVARFRKLDRLRNRRFFERIFTAGEMKYCFSKKDPAPYLAARFCAKEAVIKALAGLEIHKMPYRDIEVLNTAKGAPKVRIHSKRKMATVAVSLSHTAEYAIAFAIAYRV